MRSPSILAGVLVTSSAAGLLLPLMLACIQLLGISLPFTSSEMDTISPPQSITLTLLSSAFPSIRMYCGQLCADHRSSTLQIMMRNTVYFIGTMSKMFSMIPQLIAAGLLIYISICIGFVGLTYLRIMHLSITKLNNSPDLPV